MPCGFGWTYPENPEPSGPLPTPPTVTLRRQLLTAMLFGFAMAVEVVVLQQKAELDPYAVKTTTYHSQPAYGEQHTDGTYTFYRRISVPGQSRIGPKIATVSTTEAKNLH